MSEALATGTGVAKASAAETAADDNDRYLVPGLMRGLALLEAFSAEQQSLSLADLSKAVGLPRSSVFRLAYTLTDMGFLIRDDAAKTYRLGARVLGLGFTYLASQELIEVARPRLEALSDRTHCSAHLGVLEGTEIVYLARFAVDSAMTSGIRVGARLPAHATSIGRAILSQLPHDTLRSIFAQTPLAAFTEQTATTLDALQRQATKDAARGFALSHSAFETGIASVAAPVFGSDGKVVAAINVTTPETAVQAGDLEGRIADVVLSTAEEISSWLGYPGRKRTA
ncbi:MAG: IclR family transcriptional regulator [Bauldia litoralis]